MRRPPRISRRQRPTSSHRPPPTGPRVIPRGSPESFLGVWCETVHDIASGLVMMRLHDEMVLVVALYSDQPQWVGATRPENFGPGQHLAQEALDKARARGGVGVLALFDDDIKVILLTPPALRAA